MGDGAGGASGPALVTAPVVMMWLLTDDAVLEMPPVPLWYRGSRDYGLFLRRVFGTRGTGWAVRRLTANGQPALAAYAPEPGGGHRLHTLQVFTVTGGRVAQRRLRRPGRLAGIRPARTGLLRRFAPPAMSRAGAAGRYR
jgi:hypothetical protein